VTLGFENNVPSYDSDSLGELDGPSSLTTCPIGHFVTATTVTPDGGAISPTLSWSALQWWLEYKCHRQGLILQQDGEEDS